MVDSGEAFPLRIDKITVAQDRNLDELVKQWAGIDYETLKGNHDVD